MGCKHFTEREIFAPEILAVNQDPWSLRPQIVWDMLDLIREDWGRPITINAAGRKYCGIRPMECVLGAKRSAHKLIYPERQAFDLHATIQADLSKLQSMIEDNHRKYQVGRMEEPFYTPGWCHVEIFVSPVVDLHIFKP